MRWALFLVAVSVAFAQPPATPPADLGTFKIPPAMKVDDPKDANAPKSEDAPKPRTVFTYTGKPIGIPFACTETDMSTFGMTCTEDDPCPIYTEITGVQPVGVQLFLTGNFHNGASTMYSLFLASEDTGKTWYEAHERVS